jgi:hypothetical protein
MMSTWMIEAPAAFHTGYFFAKTGKIGGQDGWQNLDHF